MQAQIIKESINLLTDAGLNVHAVTFDHMESRSDICLCVQNFVRYLLTFSLFSHQNNNTIKKTL